MVTTNECRFLLKKIQEIEFTTLELNLYLNTHPDDGNALEQYNRMHTELCALKRQYEEQYGPLLNYGFGTNKSKTWLWAVQPWPWEM